MGHPLSVHQGLNFLVWETHTSGVRSRGVSTVHREFSFACHTRMHALSLSGGAARGTLLPEADTTCLPGSGSGRGVSVEYRAPQI